MRRFAVLMLSSVLVLGACAQDEPESQADKPEPEAVAVTATDYSYPSAPKELESGEVEFTLTNNGKEPHQAQLFKLNDGVEVAQLVETAKEDSSGLGLLELGSYGAGPNGVDGGETQTAIAQVEAGRYALFCLIPDAEGQAHLGLGMVSEIEVTQADEEAEAPDADESMQATEFSFELPEEWSGTIAVENRGGQPHEFQILGVAEGKTPEDVEKSFAAEAEGTGPPPWTADGGAAVVAPAGTGSFEIDLEPGTYFAMCFVADPEKKAPHFALGMMQKFVVE